MFAGNNDLQLYKDFFDWVLKPQMFRMRKNRVLEYADLAPLAYLRIALEGYTAQTKVKHLLIDEMQDYSPIQYKVVQKLYPCRKTILGDSYQSVNPYGSSTVEMIEKACVVAEIIKLCKSYRSSYEITEFAQKIRPNNELEPVARHGEHPRIIGFKRESEELSAITGIISSFRESDRKSLGIICKTEPQAEKLAGKLSEHTDDICFLSSRSSAFTSGVVVTSAHMAKGLEFDEVVMPGSDDKNYQSETDRSMLYVGVTRAMHKLTVTYSGKLSSLL